MAVTVAGEDDESDARKYNDRHSEGTRNAPSIALDATKCPEGQH